MALSRDSWISSILSTSDPPVLSKRITLTALFMERQFQWSVPLLDSSAYRTNGFFRVALEGDRRRRTERDPIRPFALDSYRRCWQVVWSNSAGTTPIDYELFRSLQAERD
jgi:hypothetical protein